MKTKYLEVAKIIKKQMLQTEDRELKEYLGRTAISRAYEAVFLEIYYYFTEDLNVPYTEMKKIAKEYFKEKGIKPLPSINKHTATSAYLAVKYGEIFGKMYEDLRKARNDVDYYINLQYLNIKVVDKEVSDYIKISEVIINEVIK